jgi:hypothetical protein
MKTVKYLLSALLAIALSYPVYAQQPEMQNFRPPDQRGINMFEAPKDEPEDIDGIRVRVGGGFALQFQGLSHENEAGNLLEIGENFNLPTANLDLDVQLFSGVRMHLRTYLSSRHHSEAWVKGGYLQIDRLDFIREGLFSGLMDRVRIRVGHMEINYGDTRFRRSDNGQALHNPFVGNYLMDAFTTEVGGEVYYLHNGIIAMLGITNGRLNQNVANLATKPALLAKLGYDSEIAPDIRFRLTGSVYSTPLIRGFGTSPLEPGNATNVINLYTGDRAGARYYRVMQLADATADDFRSGRITPDMSTQMTSYMINPFLRYAGLEFFGVAEFISGRHAGDIDIEGSRNWTHLGAELLYRFGMDERFYVGGRFNSASGQLRNVADETVSVNRLNIGGGWFMTPNILTKLEYVNQSYNDYIDPRFAGGGFNGFMVEAAISF